MACLSSIARGSVFMNGVGNQNTTELFCYFKIQGFNLYSRSRNEFKCKTRKSISVKRLQRGRGEREREKKGNELLTFVYSDK